MTRRPLAIAAALGAVSLALVGCEKPAPGVSAFSGSTSGHTQAVCWSFTGESLDTQTCAEAVVPALAGEGVPVIPVLSGQVVGISVDPVVADVGWTVSINSERLTPQVITSTYYRFPFPSVDIPADGVSMEVVAGSGDRLVGVWIFRLVPSGVGD